LGRLTIMAEPPITDPEAAATAVQSPTKPEPSRRTRRRARPSPTKALARLSGLTGILFAVLFVLALVLIYTTPRLAASDAQITAFYAGSSTVLVTVGQFLIPLAGIAFLWHAHTTRLLIKFRTPTPSAIPYGLQLASSILFVVLLFAGTASAGAVALLKDLTHGPLPSADVVRGMLALGYALVFIYAIRGAGMYALTTTNLLRGAGIMPTWLAIVSYLLALFLLVSTTLHPVVVLLFPTWVVVAGLVVFIRAGRVPEPAVSERQSA
jgi:hypothetical protein